MVQRRHPPKTEEKEMPTRTDPPMCHSLKRPNRSIWGVIKVKQHNVQASLFMILTVERQEQEVLIELD